MQVTGTFAAVYHRSTYDHIVGWLESDAAKPFDKVLLSLSMAGYPVRVAYPNLVVQELTGTSVEIVEGVAERSRWDLSRYLSFTAV